MTYFSGQHGKLYIDGVNAAAVVNWSMSSSMSPLDVTTLQDTDRTFINGLRSATGSCTLYYYNYTDTGSTTEKNDCKKLVDKLIKPRTTGAVGGIAPEPENVTLSLIIDDGSTTGRGFVVECLLTSAQMSMAVGEVLAAQVQFQVNGAPTAVTL